MLKKTLLTVLIAVSSSPLVAIASLDALAGAPTPVQSYHSDTAANASPKGDAEAMAQVQAIMAKAKADAAQKQQVGAAAPTAPTAPIASTEASTASQPPTNQAVAVPVANTPNPATPKTAVQVADNVSDLAGQVSTLNQTNLMFQQRTDQQIEALSTKNAELTEQLTRMGQALSIINQEVVQLSSKIQQIHPGLVPPPQDLNAGKWAELRPEFFNGFSYVMYAVLAALVVIILLMLPWYRRNDHPMLHVSPSGAAEASEGEYDFMGTHEAIPAKLDLARAYLAMEDYQAARLVLAEVQKDGSPEHRLEAQKMLESIHKKS